MIATATAIEVPKPIVSPRRLRFSFWEKSTQRSQISRRGPNSSACGFSSTAVTYTGSANCHLRSMAKMQQTSRKKVSTLSACPHAAPLTSTAGFSA